MKLKSVRLQNFRCFEDMKIDFHDRLTVIVGGNGSGKSSVLDAIAPVLNDIFCKRIDINSWSLNTVFSINDSFKNNRSHLPKMLFEFLDGIEERIDISLELSSDLMLSVGINYVSILNKFRGKAGANVHELFVYYTAKRIIQNTNFNNKSSQATLKSAFVNNTATSIDFSESLAWFNDKDAEQARERDERKDFSYTIPELQAVREAIELVLKTYENPRMKGTPPEFVVFKKGDSATPYRISQLSDGYRTMLALIMDLARRMAVTNTNAYNETKTSILTSPAIVLIDEVELHLHPSWQQRVLPDLMRVFPHTQFIVTTHSPQVLSSIAHEHIRILSNGKADPADYGTLGAESSRVLEDIFGVPARLQYLALPRAGDMENYPLEEKIDRYFELISLEEYDSDEASAISNELKTIMPDDPLLERAEAQINRARRLKKRRMDNA